jgi:hypothetical protein
LYSFRLDDPRYELAAYSLVDERPADSETWLGFVAPRIPPIMGAGDEIAALFGVAPDTDAALSILPSMAHNLDREQSLAFFNCSANLVQALASHPMNPNIRLHLTMEPTWEYDYSLSWELGLSPIPNFVRLRLIGTHSAEDGWNPDIVWHDRKHQQTEFDALCQNSTLSVYAQGFSGFQVSFPSSMRSNLQWDAHVSPVLVLNSLLHKQGGVPPAPYAELAIQRINQGDLYRRVTNLVPYDLCAANTSAIFSIVRAGADFFSSNEPSLDEIDEFCIENVAELCMRANAIVTLGGESNLDKRDALVHQLENQRSALLARVELIDYYLQRLAGDEAVGEHSEDAVSNEQHYIPG